MKVPRYLRKTAEKFLVFVIKSSGFLKRQQNFEKSPTCFDAIE